jgi:ribosomal protein S18 acetylase RimI-like enzyme
VSATLEHVLLRPARSADAFAVADLLTDCFHPATGWFGWTQNWLRAGIRQDIEGRFARPPLVYSCLVAQVEGNLVGTVEVAQRSLPGTWWLWRSNPEPLYISNLAVAETWRRRGIARLLLQEVEMVAQRWGKSPLYLHVLAENIAAVQLYKSLGYQVEQMEQNWPLWRNQPTQKLLMSKKFT